MENQQQSNKPSYKMIIPQKVEKIIRDLCNACKGHEWSGVLFYSVEGSFEANNLVIKCEDILLMDEGSSGHTQFYESPEIAEFMMEKELYEGIYTGLIHSHGGMSAFFSGEDMGTIKKEGTDRNHYVSLVVSDEKNYVAKITRKVITTAKIHSIATVTKSYNTFEDVPCVIYDHKEFVKDEAEKTTTDIEMFDLDITKETFTITKNPYLERLASIRNNPRKGGEHMRYNSMMQNPYTPPVNRPISQNTYPRQLTMPFEDSPMEELPQEETTELYSVVFNKEKVDEALCQLITGCVIPNDKIDVDKLNCLEHKKYFDTYFNSDIKKFKDWAEEYLGFICCNAEDPSLERLGFSGLDITQIFACNLYDRLDELKCKNQYVSAYMKILEEEYLPEDYLDILDYDKSYGTK